MTDNAFLQETGIDLVLMSDTLLVSNLQHFYQIQWNPLYNEVLGVMNDVLQPSQRYSKKYGAEPRYNEILLIMKKEMTSRDKR